MNHGLSTGCQCPVMHNIFSYYSGGDSGGRECTKNAGRHNSEHVLLAPPVPGVIESEVSTGVIRYKMMPLLCWDPTMAADMRRLELWQHRQVILTGSDCIESALSMTPRRTPSH
jgi:hypothetical protein